MTLTCSLDTTTFFLKRIKNIPLLTATEEKELFGVLEEYKACKILYRENKISFDELCVKLRQAKITKEKIAYANFRLVVSTAKKYVHKGVEFIDLIQDGSFGLVRAIEKFDLSKGCKFSTYALYWIATVIAKCSQKNYGLMYIPDHAHKKLHQYCKAYNESFFIGPDDKDIVDEIINNSASEELYRITQKMLSLEDSETRLSEIIIEDDHGLSLEDLALNCLDVHTAIKYLSREEKSVICNKYGLKDTSGIVVKKDKVKYIEAAAVEKLKFCLENNFLSVKDIEMKIKRISRSKNRENIMEYSLNEIVWTACLNSQKQALVKSNIWNVFLTQFEFSVAKKLYGNLKIESAHVEELIRTFFMAKDLLNKP